MSDEEKEIPEATNEELKQEEEAKNSLKRTRGENGDEEEDEETKAEQTKKTKSEEIADPDPKESLPSNGGASVPVTTQLTYEEALKIVASANPHAIPLGAVAGIPQTATVIPLAPTPFTNIVSIVSPAGDSEIVECTQDKVSQIIGSKGAIIQEMVSTLYVCS